MSKRVFAFLPCVTAFLLLAACAGATTHESKNDEIIPPAGTPTIIKGDLLTQTLTKAASPYHVTGDLRVPEGNTLTIEPGTYIDFKGHYKLDIQGHLRAIGTADQKIVFTASEHENWENGTGENRGWNGIRFLPYLQESSIGEEDWIEYCDISYSSKIGNSDMGDIPATAYINSTGGAIYLAGRPGAKTATSEVPITFHLNNNYIHHNIAPRAGGGFFTISTALYTAPDGTKVDYYYRGVYEGNTFAQNRCNFIKQQYSGGGFGAFHVNYRGIHVFKGGAFSYNDALHLSKGEQVGGIGLEITMTDVQIEPAENWIDASEQKLTNTPASSGSTDATY